MSSTLWTFAAIESGQIAESNFFEAAGKQEEISQFSNRSVIGAWAVPEPAQGWSQLDRPVCSSRASLYVPVNGGGTLPPMSCWCRPVRRLWTCPGCLLQTRQRSCGCFQRRTAGAMRACALTGHAAANDLLAVYAEDWGTVHRHDLCAGMAEKSPKKGLFKYSLKRLKRPCLQG